MLNQKQVNNLIDLGYGLDVNGTYLFKSIHGDKHHEHTAIFIQISDGAISYEGNYEHRATLLAEAKKVLDNV